MTTRRSFIRGLFAAVAAPAIVRVASLDVVRGVPFKPITLDDWARLMMQSNDLLDEIPLTSGNIIFRTSLPMATWRLLNQGVPYVK